MHVPRWEGFPHAGVPALAARLRRGRRRRGRTGSCTPSGVPDLISRVAAAIVPRMVSGGDGPGKTAGRPGLATRGLRRSSKAPAAHTIRSCPTCRVRRIPASGSPSARASSGVELLRVSRRQPSFRTTRSMFRLGAGALEALRRRIRRPGDRGIRTGASSVPRGDRKSPRSLPLVARLTPIRSPDARRARLRPPGGQ